MSLGSDKTWKLGRWMKMPSLKWPRPPLSGSCPLTFLASGHLQLVLDENTPIEMHSGPAPSVWAPPPHALASGHLEHVFSVPLPVPFCAPPSSLPLSSQAPGGSSTLSKKRPPPPPPGHKRTLSDPPSPIPHGPQSKGGIAWGELAVNKTRRKYDLM